MKKTITFDFDNTIAMAHLDMTSEDTKFIFQGYNEPIIEPILIIRATKLFEFIKRQ